MMDSRLKYVLIVAVVVLILWFVVPRYKLPVPTGSAADDQQVGKLHPAIRHDVSVLLSWARANGMRTGINSGYRSIAHQQELDDELGALAAAPGRSFHNYGLAVDLSVNQLSSAQLKAFVAKAKSLGFTWGGDWVSPREPWHFQKTFGRSINELQSRYNNGIRSNGWVKL